MSDELRVISADEWRAAIVNRPPKTRVVPVPELGDDAAIELVKLKRHQIHAIRERSLKPGKGDDVDAQKFELVLLQESAGLEPAAIDWLRDEDSAVIERLVKAVLELNGMQPAEGDRELTKRVPDVA